MPSILDLALRRLRDPGLVGQVLRFGIVGGLGFILDAGILRTLVYFGASPFASRIASLAAAVTFTWILNRSMTFAARKPPSWREFGAYVLSSLLGLLINYGLYSGAVLLHLPLLMALAIGTIAGSVFNFFRYRVLLSDKDAGEIPSP
jgi:putative flippase GtrA